jgi:DNA-binding transcriptional regulator GbsR (MarR family)
MTEMTENKVSLSPVMEKFVLHWGEMGTRWGINRTVAQVHALLFLSPRPLNAEEIAETLSVARSNVSSCLRELQSWGIVKVVHLLGDRRDHFESMKDTWEMFRVVIDERKRREIDPTVAILRECVAEENLSGSMDLVSKERLAELLNFLETVTGWYEQIKKMPTNSLTKLIKMGDRIRKALDPKAK